MKKISKIIGSVLITAAAVCLGIGVYQFTKEQNAGKGYQDLSEEVKKEPEDEGSKSKVDIPIDFAALKEKNPDVYAWISIPGTAIDYPVLQRENDNTCEMFFPNSRRLSNSIRSAGGQCCLF